MPGQRCAIFGCQSVFGKHKVSFFTIPKRKDIRSKWIRACKRKDKFNPDTSRICSLHFREDDYKLDFRSALLNVEMKRPRSLKPTAVPCIHLSPDHSEKVSPRDQRMQRRNRKILVQSLLQQSNEENTLSDLEDEPENQIEQDSFENEENTLSELEAQPDNRIEQDRFDNVFDAIFEENCQLIEQSVENREEIDEDHTVLLKIELDSDVKTEPVSDVNTEELLPLEPSSEMISTKQEEIEIVEEKIEVECDDWDEPQELIYITQKQKREYEEDNYSKTAI